MKKTKKLPIKEKIRPNIAFGRNNYLLLIIGIITIIAGFIALAKGSITLAPILLVVGYCVIIPLAILIKLKPGIRKKDMIQSPPAPANKR